MRHLFAIVCVALAAACQDPVDKAAKARIFSPEDPPQALSAAKEPLPPQSAADDLRIARRILGMGAAEATERLGAHRLNSTISWEWSGSGRTVRLKESRELRAGPGGFSGDFHARLSNDREQGFEVMRVKGRVYARSTFGRDGSGQFRERRRDRGMAERMREEAYGGLRDFDGLFFGRLKLKVTDKGTASFGGRTAWKYAVTLGDAAASAPVALPDALVPKEGPDEATRRRQAFFTLRTPRALQGEVLVDAETSVVLKARIDGRLGVATDGGESAELRLVYESALSDLGKDPALEAPRDFLPDEDKPQGIAAALKRFGIDRKAADGGVGSAGGAGEPDDGE